MLSGLIDTLKWKAFRAVEKLNLRFSTVPNRPFLPNVEFPWIDSVEAAWPDIVAELQGVQRTRSIPAFQEISPTQLALTQDDRWTTYFLYGYGSRTDENCEACPATEAALKLIPGMSTAMFSILAPGKTIPPHRGPYNGVLRYHLGLTIPDRTDQVGIRVGDETRRWAAGKSLVFDDTFEHEAWNHSDEERVVLFVDFIRPMKQPMKIVNDLVLAAFRRTPFITESLENLRAYNERNREADDSTEV